MLRYTILVVALFGVACVLSSNPAEEVPTEAEQCIQLGYDGACRVHSQSQRGCGDIETQRASHISTIDIGGSELASLSYLSFKIVTKKNRLVVQTFGEYQYCEALECARFIEGHKRARPFTADPALNGTHCLYDGICVNGECVKGKRTVTNESQARDEKYTYTCVQ